ncbi:hypothetical protein CEP53_000722 [Fusarium sp. AF-6]|nr:hypothetical protein CEP53_000722 [Fusarium sp. AF-6]
MAEYSIPDARLHRVIPSMFNAGDFPMPWIDNPTLDERRQYIRAYLKWRLPHDVMEKQERDLRDLAERKAAMRLINGNLVEIGVDRKEGDLVKVPVPGDGAPEQNHLPENEATATTQDLAITDERNQLQKLSEQVDQLRQELQQRDEQISRMDKRIRQQKRQISQRDTKITDKDRRNRYLRDCASLLRQRSEDLHLENQETRRLNIDVLEAWRQQLNQWTDGPRMG